MKLNKALVFFIAIATVFCFAGTALAENRVEVKVVSQPLPWQSLCDRAGGFTLEFDAGSTLSTGDQITIDMDAEFATSEFVYICKDISLEISPTGAGSLFDAPGTPGEVKTNDAYAIYAPTNDYLGGGIWLKITATETTQRVMIEVMGDGEIEVGPGGLFVQFLKHAGPLHMWELGVVPLDPLDPDYRKEMQLRDTLCIDISNWSESIVRANLDSVEGGTGADKYTFIPSDPQIAHMVPASIYQKFPCKNQAAGFIPEGHSESTTSQSGTTEDEDCPGFDNEVNSNFCADTHLRNYFIVESTMGDWEEVDYTIEMKILVDGAEGDNGFYFTNEAVRTDSDSSISDPAISGLCAYNNNSGQVVGTQSEYEYAPGTAPVAADSTCDVAPSARATWLRTDPGDGFGLSNDKFLLVDIPMIHYDLDEIAVNDVVSVKITIKKAPCGTVFEDTIVIGTYGCRVTSPAEQTACLTFPYFTPKNDAEWWAGIVITNLGDNDGTAKIKIYELDGDQGEAEVSVGALSQYVGLLSNLTFTPTAGTGTIGDSRSFIVVCFTGSSTIDGFAMMGDGTQGQGYLPRNCSCNYCYDLCGFSR